jgi:hypothetical protein
MCVEISCEAKDYKYKILTEGSTDFNSVMLMFYFNWMRVNDYCIL